VETGEREVAYFEAEAGSLFIWPVSFCDALSVFAVSTWINKARWFSQFCGIGPEKWRH
jgi:hypothetical protein